MANPNHTEGNVPTINPATAPGDQLPAGGGRTLTQVATEQTDRTLQNAERQHNETLSELSEIRRLLERIESALTKAANGG